MGASDFPRKYYFQSFGMSQRNSSAASTMLENEMDRGNEDECNESSDLSSGRFSQDSDSSPPPNDSHLENNDQGPDSTFLEIASRNSGAEGGLLLEQILFFLAGLGSSIGYIATLSSLVYFKVLFGANSFVYLNCAVFLPLLPISLAQAIWDTQFDLRWQSRVTFLIRAVLGYAFVMSGTIGMVTFARRGGHSNDSLSPRGGLGWVIFWALLQGIGGAVLFGQLNQLASFVGSLHQNQSADPTRSDENETLPKKFKATVSAGVQSSALVVLLASLSSGFGTMNEAYFFNFLIQILLVETLCFAAFLWLLIARQRIQLSFLRRDSSMRELTRFSSEMEELQQLISPWQDDGESDDSNAARLRLPLLQPPPSPDGSESTILSLRALLYHSRMLCLGMTLTLVPSFLVGSWFTRVQTDWMELAQILFYVRIGSDLVGRFATILVPPPSIQCVVLTAGFRCIAVVLFFFNASCKIPLRNPWKRDILSIGLVALIAFFSGYLVTSNYQLAPQQLPGTPMERAANVAKQSSLLTVAFSMSAIGGLITSFILVSFGA